MRLNREITECLKYIRETVTLMDCLISSENEDKPRNLRLISFYYDLESFLV